MVLVIFVILYLTYNDLVDAAADDDVRARGPGGRRLLLLAGLIPGIACDRYSVAVQVGFIACLGMATETGIIMLVYLREAIEKRGGLEKIGSLAELRDAVIEGAVHRLRPKLLTEGVAIIALAPMLWASGVGHEIISRHGRPGAGRAADCRRGGRHLHSRAVLLGPPQPLAEDAGDRPGHGGL